MSIYARPTQFYSSLNGGPMAAFVLLIGAWMPQRQPHHQKLLQQDDDSTKAVCTKAGAPCAVSPPKHLLLLKTDLFI